MEPAIFFNIVCLIGFPFIGFLVGGDEMFERMTTAFGVFAVCFWVTCICWIVFVAQHFIRMYW